MNDTPGSSDVAVRDERPSDRRAVCDLYLRAFPTEGEAALVDALRDDGSALITAVAERDGAVVGHVLFSPVTVACPDGTEAPAVALAPMAVDPEHQRRGIGGLLVEGGLERCRRVGERLVFVLGHPDYYPRFGFRRADAEGFRTRYPDGAEAFFVLELEPGAAADLEGEVRYHPLFDELE